MHFVDDEYPAASLARGILGHIPQFADVVDTGVAGRVDFQDIQVISPGYGQTGLTCAAGVALAVLQAVDGFGQQTGHRGLAAAPGTGKQVGVTELILAHGGPQRAGHVGLPHDLVEGFRTVFAREGLVGHAAPLLIKHD